MSKAGESILRGAREAPAYARGEVGGRVAHVPEQVDVRALRQRTGLSQAKFAREFGFALDALRNWEQGRRQPDVCARAFLVVIDREPEAVRRALAIPEDPRARRTHHRQGADAAADPVQQLLPEFRTPQPS